jgi:hypothetical protein
MNLRKKINERAIPLEDYPDTYLARAKKAVETHKKYANAFKEIIRMMKDMSWKDIKFLDGPTSGGENYQFALLPEPIRLKIRESARINPNKAKTDFKIGSLAFAKTFDTTDPSTSSDIHMKVETSGHRSHFPNLGIPISLKGTNLGYKLYRALLQKFEYLRSNTGGTTSKDYAWQSIVSPKEDAQGNLTEDDVHAIVGEGAVFAMIKSLSRTDKIRHVTDFLNAAHISKSGITKKNFAIDDELKAILPDSLLAEIDPTRREEAERAREERAAAERKRADAAALASTPERFSLYAPFGPNAFDWEIGDYIVTRLYLMQPGYDQLPVRKVVEKNGREYMALKISDLASYEADGTIPSNDPRKTSNKNEWVKSQLKRGQFNYMPDPTDGRLAVKGSPGGRRVTATPVSAAQDTNAEQEQSSMQRRVVRNFMRGEFNVCIKASDWASRARMASQRKPMLTYIVKKMGVGRTATYSVMDGRTGELQNNLSWTDFDALGLKKFDIVQLERKSSAREGDWIFIKDHRSLQGFACVVYRITPAANLQPGLYIWTGEARPQYIREPRILSKLVESTAESMSTSLFRFGEII